MKQQTVIRTQTTESRYVKQSSTYLDLRNLLERGWTVVHISPIGSELEYILEKEKS